ncbi:MAG TPA: sugar phosphate nucleotidyltransferase [Clostridia bacterium]|nr:sugar phosphate nucleotidyltransferase [Clostridia bacterium]
MAGGAGSRLRPLTCGRPKPMMPVLNRPMMEHIIDLLKQHDIEDIGVTLQYRPNDIKDHFHDGSEFGVNMQYFTEDTPLGTAGSVKNAADFLKDTFVVISGDALTDFDLSEAVKYHRDKGSIATLVLTKVDCPLEYGVVITDQDGRVKQFLEKPSWGEVFSDKVNTGIYILEPEVLDYFAKGEFFDFSRDLFPRLLADGKPMYGVVMPGYWCDIGNLQQYMEAHRDSLTGRVELGPGPSCDNIFIDETATINDPVILGSGCYIGEHAEVGPFTVLGKGTEVRGYASIKHSVTWDNSYVGAGAELRGVVTGSRVQIQAGAKSFEGTVIGDGTLVKERAEIKPGVKIWPGKTIEIDEKVNESIVWGSCSTKNLFGYEGVTGVANVELTPEFAAKVGAVYGTVVGQGSKIALSSDSYPVSVMLKNSLLSGLQSAGCEVRDLGEGITPMNRFGVKTLDCAGGVHVKLSSEDIEKSTMVFTDEHGGNISKANERKIENLLSREDFQRVNCKQVINAEFVPGLPEKYVEALANSLSLDRIAEARFKVLLVYDQLNLGRFVPPLVEKLGLEAITVAYDTAGLPGLPALIQENSASLGAAIDASGEHLVLFDDKGRMIDEEELCVLISHITLKTQNGPAVVPVTASGAIERMAEQYSGSVIRVKTSVHDLYSKLSGTKGGRGFYMQFDALSALARIIEFMSQEGLSLSQITDEIPKLFMKKEEIKVPWEDKGRVIRKLIESPLSESLELIDGVKSYHPTGWSLVLPDPEKPLCRVFSEGADMEAAESLTEMYVEKINDILDNGKGYN